MWSAILIREARLRAGLTQQELADRSGRERSVIARWEQGAVAPSLETLARDHPAPAASTSRSSSCRATTRSDERLQKNALLSPERRVQRLLQARPRAAAGGAAAVRPVRDPGRPRAPRASATSSSAPSPASSRAPRRSPTASTSRRPSAATTSDRLALALDDLGAARADGQAGHPRRSDHPRRRRRSSSAARRASSRSSPSRQARAAATTTSAARRPESRSARASAPRSPRPPTSRACSPPSAAKPTCQSSSPSAAFRALERSFGPELGL